MDEEWLNTVGSSNGIGEEMGRCYIRTWRDWDLGLELGVCVGRWASIRNWKRSRAPVDLGGLCLLRLCPCPCLSRYLCLCLCLGLSLRLRLGLVVALALTWAEVRVF